MVRCMDCLQEMVGAESCNCDTLVVDGVFYKRDTKYYDDNERCHDCGIVNKEGNLHHFGCDIEQCPICGNQLISCGCFDGKGI